MYFIRRDHLLPFLGCCLLLLFTSCSDSNTPSKTGNGVTEPVPSLTSAVTPPATRGFTPTSFATTTIPVPPTQSSCPGVGTARPMIQAPMVLGTHATVVYRLNEGTYDAPSEGKLLSYDVTTGRTTTLLTVAHAHFYEAQISADGQWVLFVTVTGAQGRQSRLQALRMDGQGLQTLYCTDGYGIQQILWSNDEQRVVFYDFVKDQGFIYLLDMTSGMLQTLLSTPLHAGLIIRTWLDTTRIYISDTSVDPIHARIYVLDIKKGTYQHLSDLTVVVLREYGDFDSSYNGTHLLISYGGCPQGSCSGPSSIGVQPITGGAQRIIYKSETDDIVEVRAIDQQNILFTVGNTPDNDTSHNGLWKIHADGSKPTYLFPTTRLQYSFLNYSSRNSWSDISRDGSMYAFQVNSFHGLIPVDSLVVGPLDSDASAEQAKVFAIVSDGSQLAMVGWTVM